MITTVATTQPEPPPSIRRHDRWILWPCVVSLLAAIGWQLFILQMPGPLNEFFFILLFTLYFVARPVLSVTGDMGPIWIAQFLLWIGPFLTCAGVFAARNQTRKAVSIGVAMLLPMLLDTPLTWAAICLHLGLTAGFGIGQVGSASTHRGQDFATYDWSTGLAGGPNTFLIYDATDQIALPVAPQHSPLDDTFGGECAGKVRHLLRHYYICVF